MNNDKTTKKGHIRYSTDLKKYLKTFILGNTSDAVLWNAISRENEENPNSTLKNTFNPNKDRLTINVVQSLLVFVIKKRIDNSDILDKLNGVFARFCFDDFSKKDKASILDILRKKTLRRFKFYEIYYSELLIFDEKILNENHNPLIISNRITYKLGAIYSDIEEIKEKIEYKKIEKESIKNPNSEKGINPVFKYISNYKNIINRLVLGFVGRNFVFNRIYKFINSHNKGYFYIIGNPGIGKTSLSAKLVNEKGYYYHIINAQNNGVNTTKDFIENICAQLIITKELPVKMFPNNFDENGTFLEEVLIMASEKTKRDEKIIIVVDGIDELKQEELTFYANANILSLPNRLPENIFFILTMRNIKDGIGIPSEENQEELKIDHKSELNKADVKEYIVENISDTDIQKYIKEQGVDETEFIRIVENKADGNFIYLNYIWNDIKKGNYNEIALHLIPQGLEAYYQKHWQKIKVTNIENWSETLQIIAALTHTFSPISVDIICEAFNINNIPLVITTIKKMEQFLQEVDAGGEKGYMFYHKSFLDFLKEKDEIMMLKRSTLNGFSDLSKDFFD